MYVDDNDGEAVIVTAGPPTVHKPPKVGINTCCGSAVPLPADRTAPVGLFSRRLAGPRRVAVTSLPGDQGWKFMSCSHCQELCQ